MMRNSVRTLLLLLAVAKFTGAAPPKDFGVPLGPPDPMEQLAIAISFAQPGLPAAPEDQAVFEKLLVSAKQAGYNTIHCAYRNWRLELCRKHGVKLMIDVLDGAPPSQLDIRRADQRDKLKQICEKLQGDKAVWGYVLCNGPLEKFAPGGADSVNECLALVRTWDPTHPVWVGSPSPEELEKIQGTAGILAADDGPAPHEPNHTAEVLAAGRAMLAIRVDALGRSLAAAPDTRQTLRDVNMALAHGVKALLWADAGAVDPKTGQIVEQHAHRNVQREIGNLAHEISEIDRPQAVCSTPTTRTADDKPKENSVPAPLEPLPADGWVQVREGEAVVGFFKYDLGWEGLFVVNHSATRPQRMTIQVKPAGDKAPSVEMFDRRTGQWKRLEVKENRFSFELAPGAGELLRLLGVATQ